MQLITDLITHAHPLLIYLIVAVVLLLESSGVPIINNTLLLFTGALASLGHLNIWLLILAAILGSITGACSAYILGARGGRHAFLRLALLFHVHEHKVNITERWFHKAGVWMIFLSRMTPYVRPFACFFGGITHMPFNRFFIAALTGSIIWCVVMVHIGAMLGPHWQQALLLMQSYTIPTLCLLALLLALYFLIKYIIDRRVRLHHQPAVNSLSQEQEQTNSDLLEV